MKKLEKNWLLRDRFILSATILDRWRQPVASGVALVPLHRTMCLVLYRRTATASETAGKYDAFSSFFLSACKPFCPPGQYGVNTCQMAASSGFRGSHELPPPGNVSDIVPAHQLGRRTGSDGDAFDRHQQFRHRQ